MKYSQNNEEPILLKFFDGRIGRFLDIGAFDGETYSNTRAMAKMGWCGVLVEPDPWNFIKLYELYKGDPKFILVNAAVDFTAHLARMWPFTYGSTIDPSMREINSHFSFREPFFIQTMSASAFNSEFANFDFINIDVEGKDMSVLYELRSILPQARAVCVEHGDNDPAAFKSVLETAHFTQFENTPGNLIGLKPGLR